MRRITEVPTAFFLSLDSLPCPARSQLLPVRRLLRVVEAEGSQSEGSEVSFWFPYCADMRTDWEGLVREPQEVHTAEPTSSSHAALAPHCEQLSGMVVQAEGFRRHKKKPRGLVKDHHVP